MDLRTLLSGVEAYVQERLSQYTEELRELCSIDSFSYHKPGLDEVALFLAARMRGLGMHATIIERESWGNDLLGTLHGNGCGNVLLLGHIDTVYPVGVATSRPVQIEGDIVTGPGVSDMKGCILSAIYAIEALLAMDYHAFGEIRFLCVSDEEINTRHCQDVMQLACRGAHRALVLEAARSNGDIVSARKGHSWYKLTANGRSAHAGVEPEKGRNAVIELAHQILQFQNLAGWREGITINAGVVSGGTLPNVVPDFAEAQFDLRFLHNEDRIAIEQRFHELIAQKRIASVELTLERAPDTKEPMVQTSEGLQLASQAQHIANLLGFSINHVLTGGASDASYATSYGIPALDGLGPIGGRDHSPDEYLVLSSVAPRVALLAGLIATVGDQYMKSALD
ncbi:MAG TPA: M20 family metallopeptidase [Ktedonobacteraceae bacterium]|nr:M20 family metallopeptidase [Ktedonobacteraceae bacterium]